MPRKYYKKKCVYCHRPEAKCYCEITEYIKSDDHLDRIAKAYALGCTDEEVCLLTKTRPDILKMYREKNPAMAKWFDLLKDSNVLLARKALQSGLVGDPKKGIRPDAKLALQILEKRRPDEYGKDVKIKVEGKVDLKTVVEKLDDMTTEEVIESLI